MRLQTGESVYKMLKISVSLKSRIDRNCQQRATKKSRDLGFRFWGFIIALQLCYKIFVKLDDYLQKHSTKFDRTIGRVLLCYLECPTHRIIHEILKSYRAALRYCVEETSLFTVKLYCDLLRSVSRSVMHDFT